MTNREIHIVLGIGAAVKLCNETAVYGKNSKKLSFANAAVLTQIFLLSAAVAV
jgi:hypothetical protein